MISVDRTVRMLSLDPGSRTLGLAIVECNVNSGKLKALFSRTLDTSNGLRHHSFMEEVQGSRFIRLKIIKNFLDTHLREFQPDLVVMESPFGGSNVQAFKILVDVMAQIEKATEEYGRNIALLKVDPPTVKKIHGVKGNSSDKTLMYEAVSKLPNLTLSDGMAFASMTEHEIDAIAVASWCAQVHVCQS